MGVSFSDEDLEALLHFWRAIGYLLGMDDKYNICIGNMEQIRNICKAIMENQIKKSIEGSHPKEAMEMSRGIVNAIKTYVRMITWEALIKYLFQVIQLQKHLSLSLYSTICYHSMYITFNYLLHIRIIAFALNYLLKLAIVLANWRKRTIEGILSQKYDIQFGDTIGKLEYKCCKEEFA